MHRLAYSSLLALLVRSAYQVPSQSQQRPICGVRNGRFAVLLQLTPIKCPFCYPIGSGQILIVDT